MKIERIDHLNITVADIDRSMEFYKRVLGMRTESMGEARAALLFGEQKIHLDLAGATAMSGEKRMPAHICFVTQTPIGESSRTSKAAAYRSEWRARAPARSARSSRSISTIRT